MSAQVKPQHPLLCYTAFQSIQWLRRIGLAHPGAQQAAVTLLFLALYLLAALIDGSFVLSGKSVGLLEHPNVLAFFLLHITVPFLLYQTVNRFLLLEELRGSIINHDFMQRQFGQQKAQFYQDVKGQSVRGAVWLRLFTVLGILAWIYNTTQNAFPAKLGFDFWDSVNYIAGYLASRAYKGYLWVLLFPACIHLQFMLVLNLADFIKKAIKAKQVHIEPLHADGCGGAKAFTELALRPLVPVLGLAFLSVWSAWYIHQAFTATPIIGASLLMAVALGLYLWPSYQFYHVIQQQKRQELQRLSSKINGVYNEAVSAGGVEGVTLLNELQKVIKAVKKVPNLPQIGYFTRVATVAYSPLLAVLVKTLLDQLIKAWVNNP